MTPIPAHPAHAQALAAIHQAAFPEGERWTATTFELQLGLPGAFAYIDPAGAMILARVAADEAEILTLAVAPTARRAGHARALLATAMQTAQTRGATSMVLEVAATNTAARALYAAAGFTEVGRRKAYYPNAIDALILRAQLKPD